MKNIDERIGMTDPLLEILLDGYRMLDWDITWDEYLVQAGKDLAAFIERLRKEGIDEEEED